MKKKLHLIIISLSITTLIYSCSDNDDASSLPLPINEPAIANGDSTSTGRQVVEGWSIPISSVIGGGPGKDGIPALENPELITPTQADFFLQPDDLVIGFKVGEETRAYPHKILDWHEIINDELNGFPIAITYCPLTGTAIGWGREINGELTTFGVSGLLYNTNLIPYDRLTDSNWSQILTESVNGKLVGKTVPTYTLVETTWQTWKELYPNTSVVSTNTGYARNYDFYPYGGYRTNSNLLFNVANLDQRLQIKTRVLGLIDGEEAKVYPLSLFGNSNVVYNDEFKGSELIVLGNTTKNYAVAYKRVLEDGTRLDFTAVNGEGDIVLADNEGNKWNIFGEAVEGPRKGNSLVQTESYIGYFFIFGAFYPNPIIFN